MIVEGELAYVPILLFHCLYSIHLLKYRTNVQYVWDGVKWNEYE